MDKIPGIGGARGIFEIFIPGIFLLVNTVAVVYFLPITDEATNAHLQALLTDPAKVLLVIIPFGYLAGVTLRLLHAEYADGASAWFLRHFNKSAQGGECDTTRYAYEAFPYTRWLGTVCTCYLPRAALDFYEAVWVGQSSQQFINFCKILVSTADPAAGAEIYAAESLARYISGMFYALGVAWGLLVGLVLWLILGTPATVPLGISVLIVVYSVGLGIILNAFRLIRLKEVETVFAASFKNRHLFWAEPNEAWRKQTPDRDQAHHRGESTLSIQVRDNLGPHAEWQVGASIETLQLKRPPDNGAR
jgi:hypothetical protein